MRTARDQVPFGESWSLLDGASRPTRAPEHAATRSYRRSGKILIIDDHADDRLLTSRFLETRGHVVETAASGQEALYVLEGLTFDLVITDIEMPGMDGFETTRRIRQLEAQDPDRRSRIPIIALTAHAVAGFEQSCLEAGIDDYLSKPVRRQELLSAANWWMNRDPRPERPMATHAVTIDPDIADLVPEFLSRCRSQVQEAISLARAGDLEAIQMIGHSFKGSGRSYGFETITVLGSLIEDLARKENLDELYPPLAELAEFLEDLRPTTGA